MKHKPQFRGWLVGVLALLALAACQAQGGGTTKPSVVIAAPPQGSTYTVGEAVAVQSSGADPSGVSRIELFVDGTMVKSDSPPVLPAPAQFNVIQTWTATGAGPHTIGVRATNPAGVFGETGITITVNPSTAQNGDTTPVASIPTATPLGQDATAAPPATQVLTLVAEAPTGAPTAAPTGAPTDAPTDVPTDTPTEAPTAAPPTATAKPAACTGIPDDFSFSASTDTITKGDTFQLSWGSVTNATGAFLNGGQFSNVGVRTPGSTNARPPTTTTYTLTAMCAPSGQQLSKTVTVTVNDNANQNTLNGNFSIIQYGSNGTDPEVHALLIFEVAAGDIDAGGGNGDNIDHVDMFIYDSNHKVVYMHTESNPAYCGFGGGDNGADCNEYVFADHHNKWPNGTPIHDGGQYTLHAIAYSHDGRKHVFTPDEDAHITIFLQ